MKIGIMGTGEIARIMAETVSKMENTEVLAVASRTEEKAAVFAEKHNIPVYYGSYEELAADDRLDLIYIATPHSRHFEDCMLCIEKGRNVLCEKAFTANKKQAEEIFRAAEEKNVFVCEAIWTRFIPMRKTLDEIISSGAIGELVSLTANLGYPLSHLDRLVKPELAGGALLDLGVYTLNFAVMTFGKDIVDIKSACTKNENGVDMHNSIILSYADGKTALLHSCCRTACDRKGIIYGTLGRIEFHNINNCEGIDVYYNDGRHERYDTPQQISGYEYEVISSLKAISEGKTECEEMPHEETLFILELMNKLRSGWGIVYPFE